MSDNTEIENLLKNIQQGLKRFSVKELNGAIVNILSNKNDKTEEIQYVLTIVCNEFEINEYALKHITTRGKFQDARQITYCLLHLNLQLPIRFIANNIFKNWPTSVVNGISRIKKLDPQVKFDKDLLYKYNRLNDKLQLFIIDKSKPKS